MKALPPGTRVAVVLESGARIATVTREYDGLAYDILFDGGAIQVLGCAAETLFEITYAQGQLIDLLYQERQAGVTFVLLERSEVRDALYLRELGVLCVEQIGGERWAAIRG